MGNAKLKVSTSQEWAVKAKQLAEAIEARSKAEKIEKALKEEFKIYMGERTSLIVGSYTIELVPRTRAGVDMDMVKFLLKDKFEKVETVTHYFVTNVRKV